jgi:hypothetical protein
LVIGSAPGLSGARRPEKRVEARSKLPQKKCTGLDLPMPGSEILKHGLYRDENMPEGSCRLWIVRMMRHIRIQADRVGYLDGRWQVCVSSPMRLSVSITIS